MNIVTSKVLQQWNTLGTRPSGKGWISANAPCCVHNGETRDKRRRGNFLCTDDGGFVYHCFNCGFKTGWKPGGHFHYKARKFCNWINMDEKDIKLLVFQAMRTQEILIESGEFEPEFVLPDFEARPLPENFSIIDLVKEEYQKYDSNFDDVLKYLDTRRLNINEVDWRWSPIESYRRKLIVPFTWKTKTIGYTARAIDDHVIPKYYNQFDSNYVYGYDKQFKNAKFVIVTEGIFDAIAVNGIALLSNNLSDDKVNIIETLNRKVVFVPDKDKAGKRIIPEVLEAGWSVALPDWDSDVKDIADARKKYGKLFTVQSIINSIEDNPLKVKLLIKKYK